MKTCILRCLSMAFILAAFSMGVQAQGFLKKLGKTAETVVKSTEAAAETVDNAIATEAVDSTVQALLTDPQFVVIPTYQTDEKGDTILNEDGTKQLRYIVYDAEGKACDPTYVKELVSARTKQYGKILKKVGSGALTGAVSGLVSGGKKGIGKGALAGGAVGLLGSTDNISQIKTINKNMKEYKQTIEAYQQTFTDEGLPIDATADLSNVNGIDFTKNEPITKSSAEIAEEMAASKDAIVDIDSLDIDSLLG